MEDAIAIAPRVRSPRHGIELLMSHLDNDKKPAHPLNDRQISRLHDLRRLYGGVPASMANSSGIFFAPKAHFDLVRAGAALYGVNPDARRCQSDAAGDRTARSHRTGSQLGAGGNHRR